MKLFFVVVLATLLFTGCFETDARVASYNLSKQADMFEIDRRIVFYNEFTAFGGLKTNNRPPAQSARWLPRSSSPQRSAGRREGFSIGWRKNGF